MANEIGDGFDSYSTAAEMQAGGWLQGAITLTATPRFAGGRYVPAPSTGLAHNVTTDATYTLGGAVLIQALNSTFFAFYDGATLQVDARIDASGHLLVTRNGTTILGPTAASYLPNTWYFMELKVTIHPSAGSAELRVGEASVLSATGTLNTRNSANNQITQIKIVGGTSNTLFDDVYANSGTGGDTGYYGDVRVDDLRPSADNTPLQWTPNSGTTTYDRLNEATPVDSTYISDATAGHISMWDLDDPATGVTTILAVIGRVRWNKDDAAARTARQKFKIGGVYYNATTVSVADTATVNEWRNSLNPATGLAWTVSDVTALLHGVELIS